MTQTRHGGQSHWPTPLPFLRFVHTTLFVQAGRAQRVVSWLAQHKLVGGVVAVVVGAVVTYFCYKVLSLISGVLLIAIWWGAAACRNC